MKKVSMVSKIFVILFGGLENLLYLCGMNKDFYILVDFDGTVVTHDYPEVGKDIGAQEVLKKLVDRGYKLILFTMRSGKELQDAVDWYDENNIPLFGINTNPTQHTWTTSPKAYGHLMIDDTGLGVPLKVDKSVSNRPFVDWIKVNVLLNGMGLL